MTGPIQSNLNAGVTQLQRLQAGRSASYQSKTKSAEEIQDFAALTVESIMKELHAPAQNSLDAQTVESQQDLPFDVQASAATRKAKSGATRADSPLDRLPFEDIRSVAERAGFVGISERDIRRAYMMGESLLADYKV
jgi:hypothetical protein